MGFSHSVPMPMPRTGDGETGRRLPNSSSHADFFVIRQITPFESHWYLYYG